MNFSPRWIFFLAIQVNALKILNLRLVCCLLKKEDNASHISVGRVKLEVYIKMLSAFLCMGRYNSVGSLKSFL